MLRHPRPGVIELLPLTISKVLRHMKTPSLLASLLFVLCSLLTGEPQAAEAPIAKERSGWRDPEDGWFDLSEMLAKPGGFVPIVMPITEPAVGFGFAGGPIFLRPRKSEGSEGWTRPNVTAAGGLYTSNQSWGLMGGDFSTWRNDSLQTMVGAAHASINLKYFGEQDTGNTDASTIGFNITMTGLLTKGRLRFGNSKFYGGLQYVFARMDVSPTRSNSDVPSPDGLGRKDRLAGPALSFLYDSRNSLFTPTKGIYTESTWSYFDPSFGGTINFQKFDQVAIGYVPFGTRWTLGVRGDADFSFGNPVFYARPYVTLRGVPAMRYQRQHLAQAEAELRWQFWKRISVVGFGGSAVAWNSASALRRTVDVRAGGAGVRYELARKFGLHYGVDVARGPEDWAIYFQFGSAWMRP